MLGASTDLGASELCGCTDGGLLRGEKLTDALFGVVEHRAREELPIVAVRGALPERLADALNDATMKLPVDDHRVDLLADVVDRDIPHEIDLAGLLVDFDQRDLDEMGATKTIEQLVLSRARGALESGCDGVIASGHEAAKLKAEFGAKLLVVTPVIRPVENKPADDQKRTVDVAQAFRNGADYIVVGRPIRSAADPRAAALAIQQTISKTFAS